RPHVRWAHLGRGDIGGADRGRGDLAGPRTRGPAGRPTGRLSLRLLPHAGSVGGPTYTPRGGDGGGRFAGVYSPGSWRWSTAATAATAWRVWSTPSGSPCWRRWPGRSPPPARSWASG